MKETVIFDIDGTLIDTEQAVLRGLQSMLKTDYGKEFSLQELEFAFGLPGSDSLPMFGIQDVPKANLRWNFFFQQYFHTAKVFDGIREILIALKENRVTTGIVTSKTQTEFKNEFAPFGLAEFFDFVVCSDQTEKTQTRSGTDAEIFRNSQCQTRNFDLYRRHDLRLQVCTRCECQFRISRMGMQTPRNDSCRLYFSDSCGHFISL